MASFVLEARRHDEMLNYPASLFVAARLLDQAEDVCRRRLMRDRDNPAAHCALAQIYRKQGRLLDAAGAYKRAVLLDPGHREASYMNALLTGRFMLAPPTGFRPAPFVLVRDVFPPSAREMFGSPHVWNAAERVHACVRVLLPAFLPQLQLAVSRLADQPVSYTYFLNPSPAADGVLLFDSEVEAHGYTTSHFTRILAEDNSLLLFPAAYFHCRLPADRENGRFVVSGRVNPFQIARSSGSVAEASAAASV